MRATLMSKLRVLIADDHTILRDGLKSLVNAQPDMTVVGEAGDGRATLEKAKALRPDVVVMDISMPELDGIQATELLKRADPQVRVLVLTAHDDRVYLRQLLEAGASGYLLKRVAVEELVNALRVVAMGGAYLDPAVVGKVVNGFVGRTRLKGELQGVVLTTREQEVLLLAARGHTNKEIAERLKISVKTVEAHKAHAMEKLELKNRADVVRYALREGWLQDS
jgi:DNA-binding NarL/FixJ family response regulator